MTTYNNNNNKIGYTTIVDGKEEENHWIRKSVLFITLRVCLLGLYSTTNNTTCTRFVNNVPVAASTSSLVCSGGGGAGVCDDVRGGTTLSSSSSTVAFSTTAAVVGTTANSSVGIVGDANCIAAQSRTILFRALLSMSSKVSPSDIVLKITLPIKPPWKCQYSSVHSEGRRRSGFR